MKYKVLIVCPDTSPRGIDIEGDSESWDFGKGAGFYVNATEPKWKDNYRLLYVIMNQRFMPISRTPEMILRQHLFPTFFRMYDYVTKELPTVIASLLPVTGAQSIMGHSMGGLETKSYFCLRLLLAFPVSPRGSSSII